MYQMLATQFNQGGPFMWAILGVFTVAVAVIIERVLYYFIFCSVNSSRILSSVIKSVRENSVGNELTILKKRKSPFHILLATALERYHAGAPIQQIEEGIQEASIKEIPKLSSRLSYLSLIANIATLVGLLGTIAGLQQSFGSLASAEAAQKAAMLSAGIAQAMNTTAFGLIVAVPCMILYTLLNNKQQSIMHDIDDAVVRTVNVMKTVKA